VKLFAGVDGGQSSTLAAIGDSDAVLGRGCGPPADLVGQARDSQQTALAIDAALDAALDAAGLERTTRFAAVVAGISGYEDGLSVAPDLRLRGERARILHDTRIAHAAALRGAAGIVVIAGTGSVALGNDTLDGALLRAGGWGYFFGDEGSALWIARTAVSRAMRADDRREDSVLGEAACRFFEAQSLRGIQQKFAHGELSRSRLAAFAAEVLSAADAGEPESCELRANATSELAGLAATLDRELQPAESRLVSYVGGLFANEGFVESFRAALSSVLPRCELRPPLGDPALGALDLARQMR